MAAEGGQVAGTGPRLHRAEGPESRPESLHHRLMNLTVLFLLSASYKREIKSSPSQCDWNSRRYLMWQGLIPRSVVDGVSRQRSSVAGAEGQGAGGLGDPQGAVESIQV